MSTIRFPPFSDSRGLFPKVFCRVRFNQGRRPGSEQLYRPEGECLNWRSALSDCATGPDKGEKWRSHAIPVTIKLPWMEPDVVKDPRKRAKTYKEISRQLPISVMTAWRKVNQKEKGKFEKTSELRLYDGRWDLITAFTPSSHNRRGVAFASAIYSSAMDAAGTRGHRLPWMRY